MTANLYFGRPDLSAVSGPAARILGASRLAAMAASPSMARRGPGRTFISNGGVLGVCARRSANRWPTIRLTHPSLKRLYVDFLYNVNRWRWPLAGDQRQFMRVV